MWTLTRTSFWTRDRTWSLTISGTPALLITGGCVGSGFCDAITSVEVFSLSSLSSCTQPQPSLPSDTRGHSQTGNLVCGAGVYDKQCWTRDNQTGEWRVSHSLGEKRYDSSLWPVQDGTLVIGGIGDASTTAVLVTSAGDVQPAFTLQYDTL